MLQAPIPELQPVLEKVEQLRDHPVTHFVLVSVEDLVAHASTPATAQHACERVVSMCNPKAWGDINATGFGAKWTGWQDFLGELSIVADECGRKIHQASKRTSI